MPYIADHTHHELYRTLDRLREAMHTPVAELDITAWLTTEPVPYARRQQGKKLALKKGATWGKLFDCAWFRFEGTVPKTARGNIVLLLDVHGELLLVDAKGQPMRGLTTKASEYDLSHGLPGKYVHSLPAKAGSRIDVWADAGCNDLFGKLPGEGRIRHADIAIEHPELRALYHDYEVVLDLAQHLPQDSARAARLWTAARAVTNVLKNFSEAEAAPARALLAPELARRAGDTPLRISAVGHAHMDLAWLWPIRETKRKTARTFTTVLRNMERHPDYVFGASQPQQYAWIKEAHPSIWHGIKKRVQEGRWELQGAMWCEPDTNVPSGESLARQLLYGQKFWREEFGHVARDLWLPDVFGYSAALPQLLRHAGVDRFMTIKLSWSTINRFPHHSFHWQGIDGSSVLAHMPPEGTYNSSARPRSILAAERNYLDKGVSGNALLVFGIGDGGGGPGDDHLERLTRSTNLQGLSRTVQEPAAKFFDRLASEAAQLPTWQGELYLEKHQGTYTTQGRNKAWNRAMEWSLHSCELANARAAIDGLPYPHQKLLPIWQEVLLYQFHDILPGSSITRVYDESLVRYAELHAETQALTASADRALHGPTGKALAVVNDLSWARSGWVQHGRGWSQLTVPALGSAVLTKVGNAPSGLSATTTHLDNGILRVRIGRDGLITSLIHVDTGRECLSGPANRLAVFRDDGDAWDFSPNWQAQGGEAPILSETSARIDGPHAIVTQVWRYQASTITQELVLTAGSGRLDFRTTADWQDGGRMLRTSFPVAVRTDHATCHIQFGTLQRPTHRNTSWDMAKDEICCQNFIDLSERTHGVALLNNGKYGHRACGDVLDLHLLRTPGFPDPHADRAVHTCTYALFPHAGDHVTGHVMRAGYELNCPLRTVAVQTEATPLTSLVEIDAEHVIIDTVKQAEDGKGIVLRLFESAGQATTATLRLGIPCRKAWRTDLHEQPQEAVAITDHTVVLDLRPFEIVTLRLA